MAIIEEIKETAARINDATAVGENTAERVGGCLMKVGDALDEVTENANNTKKDVDTLMDEVFPVVVALAGGKSQNGTANATITASVKVKEEATDANTIVASKTLTGYDGTTKTTEITFTKASTGVYTYTDNNVGYGRNKYNLKAGVEGKTAKDAVPVDVYATYPVYVWLSSSAQTTIPSSVKTLTSKARVSQCTMTSDYAASSSSLYYYIAVPVGWNVASLSVQDVMGSNSFEITKITSTPVTDGNGNSYNIFRSSKASWKTTATLVFKPSGSEKY